MLSVDALTCFRGERLVLRDVGFTLAPGAALLLTGANGAGKSTLLRLLAGLRRPDGGRILWDGAPITDDPGGHAARCGFIGEQNALKPGLTAAENLRFAAAGRAIAPALAAFDLTGLADLPTRMLSAGQRRRLALSRLLMRDAPLWLLDEPTTGLDSASVERLGGLLAAHRASGGMVVAATHLPLPMGDTGSLQLKGGAVVR